MTLYYFALALILFMSLVTIVYFVAEVVGHTIAAVYKLCAGKNGGLFYVDNGKRRYI